MERLISGIGICDVFYVLLLNFDVRRCHTEFYHESNGTITVPKSKIFDSARTILIQISFQFCLLRP